MTGGNSEPLDPSSRSDAGRCYSRHARQPSVRVLGKREKVKNFHSNEKMATYDECRSTPPHWVLRTAISPARCCARQLSPPYWRGELGLRNRPAQHPCAALWLNRSPLDHSRVPRLSVA